MRLKDYQGETLDTLDAYVAEIVRARATEETTRAAFAAAALNPAMLATMLATLDPPVVAWTAAQAMGRTASPDPWRPLPDGHGRQVPHVCLNLPTGSGKTLIGGHAVGRILTGLDAAMTGFVLWVVPSDAIYRQTLGQLRDKGSPLRQALETASGGRVRIIEKMDDVVRADVDAGLTVMLLMLQGARVRKAESLTKEDLKIFRESGNYATFFPDADDRTALAALRRAVPNLDGDDLGDATGRPGVGVRQSLANTLRIVRPLIVLDEGHNAYSPERRAVLAGFNPRFLLELTATPDRELSNVLVKIGGLRLRDEEMIKLPIELEATDKAVWRDTLKAALDRRAALEVDAAALHARTGRFIRPILLVRVERTGRDQREAGLVHAEDVYEALTQTMGVPPEWVRRQTSVDKELDGREGSETSDVRIIITKDALKEGWDCPSAYVLALLSRTQAKTALTQMIGRVLRQPEAKRTHVDALDSAWVFCCDIGVGEAVEGIRAGLDRDGMGDLRASVRTAGATATTRTVERRPALRGRRLLVPRVTHGDGRGGWRRLDYDADILGGIDWTALTYDGAETIHLDDPGAARRRATIDYRAGGQFDRQQAIAIEAIEARVDRPDLARRLLGVIPNPWVAMRLVDIALAALRARGLDDGMIARGRLVLIDSMREELAAHVEELARGVFVAKLASGAIAFTLRGDASDWMMPPTESFAFAGDAKWELDSAGDPLGKTLFERLAEGQLNPSLERPVALYLDQREAVEWWWRLVSRGAWGLQGWRRHAVYPDFLIGRSDGRLLVLETKGRQLAGNDDTDFKRKLLNVLEAAYKRPSPGTVELFDDSAPSIKFRMVMQTAAWQSDVAAALT